MSRSSPPPSTSCPLTDKLPAELRDAIYAHLSFGTLDYPRLRARHTWITTAPPDATPVLYIPALARTCRTLRADVLSRYLGDLRVELSDSSQLDGVFFERCLRALGSAVLHVRRLTIEHKVDFCLDEDAHDAVRTRATTVFKVTALNHGKPEAGSHHQELPPVTVSCDFKPAIPIGDELLPQSGSVCDCPLADRLSRSAPLSVDGTDHVTMHTEGAGARPLGSLQPYALVRDCPLTRSIASFLNLLDHESSIPERETRPRFHPGGMMYLYRGGHIYHNKIIEPYTASCVSRPWPPTAEETSCYWPWPVCDTCNRRKWLLQGPTTGPHYIANERWWRDCERSGKTVSAAVTTRVRYLGHIWILCPYEPADRRGVPQEGANTADCSTVFRCRWGPTRPPLVRPYGQKSRRFL